MQSKTIIGHGSRVTDFAHLNQITPISGHFLSDQGCTHLGMPFAVTSPYSHTACTTLCCCIVAVGMLLKLVASPSI